MVFQLLSEPKSTLQGLAHTLLRVSEEIDHCQQCRTYTEQPICPLCANPKRDSSVLCVVETPAEMLSLEQSGVFRGHYFILHGRLSPLDGVGPDALGIPVFLERLKNPLLQEIILATNPTVEGEATAYYLTELAMQYQKKISRIAYGVPVGSELEYIDGQTLSHAVLMRQEITGRQTP
jgi:recombination protein RecR